MRLKGKNVVVTGAGQGMGRLISLRFANEGANLVLAGRQREPLESLVDEIQNLGRRALAVPTDVSEEGAVEMLISEAGAFFDDRIDILMLAAGITGPLETPVWELAVDDFEEILAVNLRGMFLPIKHVLPHMIKRRSGKIVTIGGVAGIRGYHMRTGYSASKWGIRGLVRTVALEVGPHNINVNNICPGLTETPRMQKLLAGKAAARGWSEKDIYQEYVQEMSLGRISQPQDIADAALFLASDESRNITGQDLIVDGGWKL